MLTAVQMKSLKKVNVSANAERSRQRLKEDFSASSRAQQKAIVDLSGLKRSAIYNAYRTGVVSAKVALAFAQVLDVSPFYYTGEEKARQKLQEAMLLLFLQQNGYTKLLEELGETGEPKQPAKRGRKAKDAPVAPAEQLGAESAATQGALIDDTLHVTLPDSEKMRHAVGALSDDETAELLVALLIRARFNEQAKEKAEWVKRVLLD